MHRFTTLVERCVGFTTFRLDETLEKIEARLAVHASSVYIKNLQSIKLQYTITAVGMFSIFDAKVQREFGVIDGFSEIRARLTDKKEIDLLDRFEQFALAVNVLKHGEGRSYDRLLDVKDRLPFTIKGRGEDFYNEGDCSEIDTLVDADSDFLKKCAKVIYDVSKALSI